MEPHKVLSVVSSDIDILVIYGDKRPHKEASERIPTVPGRDRNGSLQEIFADPPKCIGRVSRDNTKARESILVEHLAKISFCLKRESKVKSLPNQAKRLQEQREWMRSFEQLKAWENIVISSDDEEALLRQITVSSTSGPSTSKARNNEGARGSVRVS